MRDHYESVRYFCHYTHYRWELAFTYSRRTRQHHGLLKTPLFSECINGPPASKNQIFPGCISRLYAVSCPFIFNISTRERNRTTRLCTNSVHLRHTLNFQKSESRNFSLSLVPSKTVRQSHTASPIRWTEICPIICRLQMPCYRRRLYWWLSTWTKYKHWRKSTFWRDIICNKRNLTFSSNTIKVCKSTRFV